MAPPLKLAFLGSEAVPFIKLGGLAYVVGALPKYLSARGHDVIVVLPKYTSIDAGRWAIEPFLSPLGVWMGDTEEWCAVFTTTFAGVRFFFIESSKYFERKGIYHDPEMDDYRDNARRFGFFTRAALQLCRDIGFAPDIVHARDWQTALAPAYLKIWHWDDAVLGGAASVLTIHNIGHQGKYQASDYDYLGLQRDNFTPAKFEDFGGINMLKGGIVYADLVTTVSPTYAVETRTDIGGAGLAPVLNDKGGNYWGILNGVDGDEWNPATDALIPVRFDAKSIEGKAACKAALQERMALEVDPGIPLIGVIGRFVAQKGLDLLAASIERILKTMRVQFAILGTGDKGRRSPLDPKVSASRNQDRAGTCRPRRPAGPPRSRSSAASWRARPRRGGPSGGSDSPARSGTPEPRRGPIRTSPRPKSAHGQAWPRRAEPASRRRRRSQAAPPPRGACSPRRGSGSTPARAEAPRCRAPAPYIPSGSDPRRSRRGGSGR